MGWFEERMKQLKKGGWEGFCGDLAELEKNLSFLILLLIKREYSLDVREIHYRIREILASLTSYVEEYGGVMVLDYYQYVFGMDVSLAKNRSIKDLITLKEKVHQTIRVVLCDCVIKGDWEKDFKSMVDELICEYNKIIEIEVTRDIESPFW